MSNSSETIRKAGELTNLLANVLLFPFAPEGLKVEPEKHACEFEYTSVAGDDTNEYALPCQSYRDVRLVKLFEGESVETEIWACRECRETRIGGLR